MNINIGDLLFTIFTFGFIIVFIALVIWLVVINKRRNRQLKELEEKLDRLHEKVERHDDSR